MDMVLFLGKLQSWFNIFYIFILPFLGGIQLRLLLRRRKYAWVLTAVFGILAVSLLWWVKTTPQRGYEGPGLFSLQLLLITLGSLLTGLACRLKLNKK
ncbi:hypothetical protein [Dysosmobacter sp.]|uniref:hypothetical protein n=1 Tax=Dysosmobacter sp. TaxID=2591382 RepID=UPI002A9D2557|nr:hypothetical protein [Dysosmobacter sp.]MDY5612099.1 hypothetical protein [Dysosmobacter sp.]